MSGVCCAPARVMLRGVAIWEGERRHDASRRCPRVHRAAIGRARCSTDRVGLMITPIGANDWRNGLSGFLGGYGATGFVVFLYLVETWAYSSHPLCDLDSAGVPGGVHQTEARRAGVQRPSVFSRLEMGSRSFRRVVAGWRNLGHQAPVIIFAVGPYLVRWLNDVGFAVWILAKLSRINYLRICPTSDARESSHSIARSA